MKYNLPLILHDNVRDRYHIMDYNTLDIMRTHAKSRMTFNDTITITFLEHLVLGQLNFRAKESASISFLDSNQIDIEFDRMAKLSDTILRYIDILSESHPYPSLLSNLRALDIFNDFIDTVIDTLLDNGFEIVTDKNTIDIIYMEYYL